MLHLPMTKLVLARKVIETPIDRDAMSQQALIWVVLGQGDTLLSHKVLVLYCFGEMHVLYQSI